jgi:hypothetical protein
MPDVAADNKGFMVVWHGFQGEETTAKIFARRVGADGTVGDLVVIPPAKAYRANSGSSPRIAWNGKEHLVVYFGMKMILWQRIDTAGNPLPTKLPRHPIRGGDDTPWQFSVSPLRKEKDWTIMTHGGPPNYWGRSVGTQSLFRITAQGEKDVSVTLDTSKGKKRLWPYEGSAVVPDGQRCVAVWQRYHIGGSGQAKMDLINCDILAARVENGKVLDTEDLFVAASDADELDPALAGNGAGKLLCVYEKVVDGKSMICAKMLGTK